MTGRTPRDDVEFLARSPHRVRVLRTLASGPRTRPTLHETADVPQPTLGRILGDFEERHWVERRDREYALTPSGELLAESFRSLLETVETVQNLSGVLLHLPTDEMPFDLRAFEDATVTTPEAGNVFGPVDRLTESFFGAERARIMVDTAPPGTRSDHVGRAERFMEGDRRVESINSASALDQARDDPEMARWLRAGIESGRSTVYEYDGEIPFVLGLADGVALLAPTDENGVPVALVETERETVRSWVEDTLDDYRAQSRKLRADEFPV